LWRDLICSRLSKNITTTSQKPIAKEICLNSKVEISLNQSMISKIYNGIIPWMQLFFGLIKIINKQN